MVLLRIKYQSVKRKRVKRTGSSKVARQRGARSETVNSAQNKWKTAAGGEIYPDFKDEESGLRMKFYVSGESVTARNEPRDRGDQTSGDEGHHATIENLIHHGIYISASNGR